MPLRSVLASILRASCSLRGSRFLDPGHLICPRQVSGERQEIYFRQALSSPAAVSALPAFLQAAVTGSRAPTYDVLDSTMEVLQLTPSESASPAYLLCPRQEGER